MPLVHFQERRISFESRWTTLSHHDSATILINGLRYVIAFKMRLEKKLPREVAITVVAIAYRLYGDRRSPTVNDAKNAMAKNIAIAKNSARLFWAIDVLSRRCQLLVSSRLLSNWISARPSDAELLPAEAAGEVLTARIVHQNESDNGCENGREGLCRRRQT